MMCVGGLRIGGKSRSGWCGTCFNNVFKAQIVSIDLLITYNQADIMAVDRFQINMSTFSITSLILGHHGMARIFRKLFLNDFKD